MNNETAPSLANEEEDDDNVEFGGRLNVNTINECYAVILEMAKQQIQHAHERGAPFNTSIKGDSTVKTLIKSLLPLALQRQTYLKCIQSIEDAARSSCLFGAPPYPFLLPSDNQMLNASGMARNRVNLAYEYAIQRRIISVAHFGSAHMIDSHNRKYRIVQDDQPGDSPVAMDSIEMNNMVTMYVKLIYRRAHTRDGRLQSHRIPKVGEIIEMKTTSFLHNVLNQRYMLSFLIKGIHLNKRHARICILQTKCLTKSALSIHGVSI